MYSIKHNPHWLRFLSKEISKLVAIQLKTLPEIMNANMLLFCISNAGEKFSCLPDATVALRIRFVSLKKSRNPVEMAWL